MAMQNADYLLARFRHIIDISFHAAISLRPLDVNLREMPFRRIMKSVLGFLDGAARRR